MIKIKQKFLLVLMPIIGTVGIYFFNEKLYLLEKENKILEEKYIFLQEEKNATSYEAHRTDLLSQKIVYENKIELINKKIDKIRKELIEAKGDYVRQQRLLVKKEALLNEKNIILGKFNRYLNQLITENKMLRIKAQDFSKEKSALMVTNTRLNDKIERLQEEEVSNFNIDKSCLKIKEIIRANDRLGYKSDTIDLIKETHNIFHIIYYEAKINENLGLDIKRGLKVFKALEKALVLDTRRNDYINHLMLETCVDMIYNKQR